MVVHIKPTKKYPGGGDCVKYTPEGGSFAFYPSGRMAIAFERMGAGFYLFAYADNATGTTIAAFDPYGCGYVANPANGKPRLTSRKHGGTFASLEGDLEKIWTTQKPLKEPIEFELTPSILMRFTSRLKVFTRFSSQGITEEYLYGEAPAAQEGNYLQKSLGVIKMGPERGKQNLDVDLCREHLREIKELKELNAMKELDASATLAGITEDFMQKHPPLRPIVASTDALKASVARGEWNVEVFNSKAKLAATLGDSLPTLRIADETLRGDPHSRRLEGMLGLRDPHSASVESLRDPETYPKLVQDSGSEKKGVLPMPAVIKGASGRYRPGEVDNRYRTPRKRLRELKANMYDTFLKEEAPKGTMVVVCCLAGWLPQSKRLEPVLEMLVGEMWQFAKAQGKPTKGVPPPDPAAAAGGPLMLCKYEMSESRFLRDRHNINTLPMFLMYYDGKLCYASNTLNGYGTSRDDLLAQVAASRMDAQRGAFLPPDFRFGATDNKLTASFTETLTKTSTKLGA